jgi:hypothetical protein
MKIVIYFLCARAGAVRLRRVARSLRAAVEARSFTGDAETDLPRMLEMLAVPLPLSESSAPKSDRDRRGSIGKRGHGAAGARG